MEASKSENPARLQIFNTSEHSVGINVRNYDSPARLRVPNFIPLLCSQDIHLFLNQ